MDILNGCKKVRVISSLRLDHAFDNPAITAPAMVKLYASAMIM